VQSDRQVGIVGEHIEERRVAVLIRGLEHAVEIADRLVVVEGEDEAEGEHCGVGATISVETRMRIEDRGWTMEDGGWSLL
jgi:hypothetical protein